MVTKRIRSEYMKKFKDPKWETYTKCYEEMLKYRLTRRLLEHTHNPWFWNGSDSDSESGGRSSTPPSKNQVGCETDGDGTQAELEECEGARQDQQNQQTRTTVPGPSLPLRQEEHSVSAIRGSQLDGARETRVQDGEREEQGASGRDIKQISAPHREQVQDTVEAGPPPQHNERTKSTKRTWRYQQVRPASSGQHVEDNKGSRHPFALYGSGEKAADIAARKTHNVGPAASTREIHESALRAKNRREVERQIQTQRTERRRAKSADVDKARKLPEFNPWLTEYMRCFSARSR
ncbi:centriole, cilia and spindle-associated protein [Betta splendens]|uniref:Centriole, cilia and spindle-associated protein n=1 Tax=Betta splendens TaxID=158456 RepID=A0A6P7M252_BETSP|nr:centriole, cilia and spindle-associated protein [Betta splendens]